MLSLSVWRLLTLCLSFSSRSAAAPYVKRDNSTSTTESYFNVDGDGHAARSKSLTDDGYRITTLSVYGSPPNIKYAAIWAHQDGPAFETIHDADKSTYDAWLESWKAKGYVSTQISATGSVEDAVYAGVVEDIEVANWVQSCELENPWSFFNMTNGIPMLRKGFRMFGTSENPRYCILGHENVKNEQETMFDSIPAFTINFPEVYEAELLKPFWRPQRLYASETHVITPVFVDTNVGKWSVETGLTASELDQEIKAQASQGLVPVDLQGGGVGDDARFNVIFAEQHTPEPRKWSSKGDVLGFEDNESAAKRIDQIMQTFMTDNGVRQAQFAVGRNGSIIAERSYTLAESNRAVVEPDDIFLLASLSKMFVHAAIADLVDRGLLNYTTLVYPVLGYKPFDERANKITVQHLLDHKGGYDRTVTPDPSLAFHSIAHTLPTNGSVPATLRDVIEYMVARPLDFEPGEYPAYSNYGPMLLSYVLTNITGVEYYEYLKENILDGLDVRPYATDREGHLNDRIVQESKFTGFDPVAPSSMKQVPAPFGGDGAIKEACMGTFSLASSASSIARFIGTHAVWGTGGRVESSRDGSLAGARAWAQSTGDIDWVITINTREYVSESTWSSLIYWDITDFVRETAVAA
ncbi:hypothetical protein ACHAQA_005765 [Verticillium albo-atrum]